ncbi:uncharacterized protein [Chelonus insularis]|uniref:uncharacterized protein isoform X2 n=1 Tax=Chelonus insularis TaxID=460826 RepID=UPI00158F6843|nr:uncharacterized protein LOC118067999 isoform X2 [Chelonus insularis]
MSRAVKSKQLSTKSSTKENVIDSMGTKRSTRARPATSTTQNIKVILKKGKDEKAATGVTRSSGIKFTRSRKSKDDEQSKEIGSNIEEKKTSLAKDETSQRKKQNDEKMQGPTSSNSKEKTSVRAEKNIRPTRLIEKASNDKASSNVTSLEKNKNIKKISELPEVVKINTRSTKAAVLGETTEPSSKKTSLKQTKLSAMRLRKTSTKSTEEDKPSKEVEEQKKPTVSSITRSKTRDVKSGLDIPSVKTSEDTKESTKKITRAEDVIDIADDNENEPKSPQHQKKSVTSKIPTRKSTKNVPTTSSKRRSSIRIKNTVSGKKFFSNRSKPVGHSKISPLKRAVIGMRQKNIKIKKARVIPVPRESSSFHLRQTTLSESFSNHAKKTLRPRNTDKNYCEDSQIVNKRNSPQPGVSDEKKGPIYKKIQLEESQEKDKEKVYDFIPDKNDVQKKRKKKVVRKAPVKKAKTVMPKTATVKSHMDAVPVKTLKNLKAEQAKSASNKKLDNEQKIVQKSVVVPKILTNPPNETNAAVTTYNNPHTIEVTAEIYAPPSPDIGHEATDMQEILKLPEQNKPRIISDQDLRGEHRINITGTPLQPKLKEEAFSRPFRETNAFNMKPSMQMKTMMDHSLIRRSLSPISKAETPAFIEDTGSPWRPFVPNTFSRVKNVFQSTPQGDRFTSNTAKTAMGFNKQLFGKKMTKIEEQKNENDSISKNKLSPVKKSVISKIPVQSSNNTSKSPMKSLNNMSKSPIKTVNHSKSPRKFGTEISNINLSDENQCQRSPSKSPRKFGFEISNINQVSTPKSSPTKIKSLKRPVVETQNSPSIIEIPPRISPIPAVSEPVPEFNEIIEDKENSAPNNQSPLRTSTETIQAQTPIRPAEESVISPITEKFEPQPGPSGLQKTKSPDDAWKLKQTNLNKFLNLPDMPESTRISAGGIFDDVHSTPINGKKVKKLAAQLDVVDAFGFDEPDDSSSELEKISPINREPVPLQAISNKKLLEDARKNLPKINKDSEAHPVRFSMGEIKKTLQKNKEKDEVEEAISTVNQKFDHLTKKNVVQAISFTDTFDVENEDKNTQDIVETIKEIPLFVDLEPVHFTQPPRYSYKRKRHHQSYEETEDEAESDEDEKHQKRPQKKKKIGKAEREQKKKLDMWAKNMNETFEEIDHFDLVVE